MSLPTSLPVVLLTDIHGCYHSMVRLLNAIPKPFQLVLLGDLIDRGPSSRKVVEFAMENAIPTVVGNHEDLCLAFYNSKAHCSSMYDKGVWLDNGGDKAVRDWKTIDKRGLEPWQVNQAERIGGRIPDTVLSWMEGLPPHLYPTEEPDANGLRLLASHTGYGLEADDGDWFTALWGRRPLGDPDFPVDGNYRIFGHTQQKEPLLTDAWACIDTGAAYGKQGYGVLSAMVWPTKQLYSQVYNEQPINPAFTVELGGILT